MHFCLARSKVYRLYLLSWPFVKGARKSCSHRSHSFSVVSFHFSPDTHFPYSWGFDCCHADAINRHCIALDKKNCVYSFKTGDNHISTPPRSHWHIQNGKVTQLPRLVPADHVAPPANHVAPPAAAPVPAVRRAKVGENVDVGLCCMDLYGTTLQTYCNKTCKTTGFSLHVLFCSYFCSLNVDDESAGTSLHQETAGDDTDGGNDYHYDVIVAVSVINYR